MWKPLLLKGGEPFLRGDIHIGPKSQENEERAKETAKEFTIYGIVPTTPRQSKYKWSDVHDNVGWGWPGYWFVRYYEEPESNEFGPVSL